MHQACRRIRGRTGMWSEIPPHKHGGTSIRLQSVYCVIINCYVMIHNDMLWKKLVLSYTYNIHKLAEWSHEGYSTRRFQTSKLVHQACLRIIIWIIETVRSFVRCSFQAVLLTQLSPSSPLELSLIHLFRLSYSPAIQPPHRTKTLFFPPFTIGFQCLRFNLVFCNPLQKKKSMEGLKNVFGKLTGRSFVPGWDDEKLIIWLLMPLWWGQKIHVVFSGNLAEVRGNVRFQLEWLLTLL